MATKFSPEVLPAELAPLASLFHLLFTEGDKARDISTQYQLATGGDKERVEELINTSTDEDFANYRALFTKLADAKAQIETKMADALEAITKVAKEQVSEFQGGDVEELRKSFTEAKAKVTAFETALKSAGVSTETLAEIYAKAEYVPVGGLRGTRKNNSGTTGMKRYKFASISVDGEVIEGTSVSHIAAYTGIANEPIRSALVEAAGTVNISEEKAGQVLTISVVKDDVARTVEVTV